MNISYYFLGSVTVSSDYESITSLLNLCMLYSIPYSDFQSHPDKVTMIFRLTAYKKLKKEAESRGIRYTVEKKSGLPVFFEKYKYRAGLFCGIICAAMLVFLSHQFVWDINVTGNKSLTTSEVSEVLREHGFHVGSSISRANTDRIENRILIDSDKISWISINIIGTVAEVEIREREEPKSESVITKPANLVAKKDGVIEEVRIFRGKTMVGAGKYVKKGELLVSGLFDSVQVGFRYTRAAGEVYARTVEEFYIEIPYKYDQKIYSGEEYCNKYLNFFDYSMNISKKCGNEGALYDKIDIVENCNLFDILETPFSLRTEKYLEYKTVSMTRSPAEAEELAYFELEGRLSSLAENTTLIKKSVTPYEREDRFLLHCVIVLIEDIACVSEFEVELDGQK